MHFLLVEDDDDHAEIVLDIFTRDAGEITIDRVCDGQEALGYLHAKPPFEGVMSPDVVLLDINLPKISGLEVLASLKRDKQLKVIPVVMLTTSEAESDRNRAYAENVNSYVVKPIDFEKMEAVIQDIRRYWTSCNKPAK